jgi:hypothetical protein
MKKVLTGLLVLLMGLVAFIALYRWDSGSNRGYEFGYWGSFNRIRKTLEGLPGIRIVKSGHNADVVMEEFGFDISTAPGRTLHIWFKEDDPIRGLSGGRLTKALAERIEKEATTKAAGTATEPPPETPFQGSSGRGR